MKKLKLVALILAVLMSAMLLTSCAGAPADPVMSIDGVDIGVDEYIYYLRSYKSNIENSMGTEVDPWSGESGDTLSTYIKSLCVEQAKSRIVIDELFAELGLSLSDEDKQAMKDQKKEAISTAGGTSAYEEMLKNAGLNDRLYDLLTEASYKYNTIYDYYYGEGGEKAMSEEEFDEFFKNNYMSAAHVLKLTIDLATGLELSEEEKAAKYEELAAVLERAKAGEDFDALAAENTEDTGIATYPNGYTFTSGEVDEVFYETAAGLAENEISDIVESSSGYHIVKRLPLDTGYYEANKESIQSSLYESQFGAALTERMDSMEVVYNDIYEEITPLNYDLYVK